MWWWEFIKTHVIEIELAIIIVSMWLIAASASV